MSDLLPGMRSLDPPMVQAVRRTLEAKREAGLIRDEHEALCQLAIELAIAIAAGSQQGKTSTPHCAQQLLNTLAALPALPDEAADDVLAEAIRA